MTDTNNQKTIEENRDKPKPSWQQIQEKKINMVKERGSRVMKVNSPLTSTMFNVLRQFDMAYAHFKSRLGEMGGISHEEGEELMAEGRELVLAFSSYTAKISKRVRFHYFTPDEIRKFTRTTKEADSE